MQDLFRQGAFQGNTPQAAYFVKCDGDTTTQQDIDNGIVNIVVGFAPLKPAEFVIHQDPADRAGHHAVTEAFMAEFTVNPSPVRSLQEFQVPREMGRPIRRGRQQGFHD